MKLLSIAAIALLFLFHAPLGAQVRLLGKTQATVSITNDPDNQTIGTNSSNKLQVKDGGITEQKLQDGAVTTTKILDNTIDSTDFGTGARYYIQTHAASSVTINNTPDGETIRENASGKLEVFKHDTLITYSSNDDTVAVDITGWGFTSPKVYNIVEYYGYFAADVYSISSNKVILKTRPIGIGDSVKIRLGVYEK